MAAEIITVSPMLYENQQRIRVDIPYDPGLIQKIRTISGARQIRGSRDGAGTVFNTKAV
ncbi:MAG: hypothetical protein L6Q97_15565 [Thermoanaerobaculia bacterium]|nr:hypothetical protein [Thermoanaerobaculia bacterium]